MGTPEEVTLALKEASDNFNTVVGKHNDNDLMAISDVLVSPLMQVVKCDATTNIHKLFGVVAADDDYTATTG